MNSFFRKYLNPLVISIIIFCLSIGLFVLAGSELTKNTSPEPSMYTLEDIYNLIHADALYAPVVPGSHNIYPSSAPTATSSYSVSQLYADLANLIKRENVATGTVYLGVTGAYGTPDPTYATTTIIASSLTPTVPLGDPIGYSLEDIWNLINDNTTTTPGSHTSEPQGAPASSMHSLTDIYEALISLGIEKSPSVNPTKTYLGIAGTFVPPPTVRYTNGTGGGNWADISTWAGGIIPTTPDVAEVMSGDTIDEIPTGETVLNNNGIITINNGVITNNNGKVSSNGDFSNLTALIETNSTTGVVELNYGTIDTNNGVVGIYNDGNPWGGNFGTIEVNNSEVYINQFGSAIIETNNLHVGWNGQNAYIGNNAVGGFITINTDGAFVNINHGLVITNGGDGNGGTVTENASDGTVDTTEPGASVMNNKGIILYGTFYYFIENEGAGDIRSGELCQSREETGGTVRDVTFSINHPLCYNYIAP